MQTVRKRTLLLAMRTAGIAMPGLLVAFAVVLASNEGSGAPGATDASFPDAKPSWDAGKPSDAFKLDAPPKFDAPPKLDAKLDAKTDAYVPPPILPDPTPLTCDAVYVLTVKWDKGTLTLDKVRTEKLAQKAALPRKFGRFAAELYVGDTLLERLRFDIPLLVDDSVASETYAKGLVTTVDVKIPDSERPNRLEIWDRATDKRWKFVYPLASK